MGAFKHLAEYLHSEDRPHILLGHTGEYMDPIKMDLIDKFPALTDKDQIVTTDEAYLYRTIVTSRKHFDLLVLTESVDLEKVKKILKRLPYTLPTIVLAEHLPTPGPKINELMTAVPSLKTWKV